MLPITFSLVIGNQFSHSKIRSLCQMIDEAHLNLLKCNDLKHELLHLLQQQEANELFINYVQEAIR